MRVRLDSLFPLLTVASGKSAPERCWMTALTGRSRRETCRGQHPKYKHSGPLGPLTWHHYHSWCKCLSSAKLPRRQYIKKAAYTNFNPSCFFDATGQEHIINSLHSGSTGFVYTGWSRCISISQILSPIEMHLNSKIWIPSSSLGSASNTKVSRRWRIQHAVDPKCFFLLPR